MGLSLTLERLLFFLGLYGISTAENCTNHKLPFEKVFSVPGDVAMLNSTLVSPDVFNFTSIPYNISWYDSKTGNELNEQTGRVLVEGATLWFLNITLEDDGEYVTIVRTPSQCFRQVTKLVVNSPIPGNCGRPQKAHQSLTAGVNDNLSCPLKGVMKKLQSNGISYSIKWYKGCDFIVDETKEFGYSNLGKLLITGVKPKHSGSYTCTLTFTLGGINRSVSETIEAWVKEEHSLSPRMHAPANEIIYAATGTNFSKQCLVFVPCIGKPMVDIYWLTKGRFVSKLSTDRIHMSKTRKWSPDSSAVKGVFLERELIFTEVREEDFKLNYTCRAYSDRGHKEGSFTLLPTDPCIITPIGSTLGVTAVLFIISVIIYYMFKIDIVLWFRSGFPMLYKNKDLDGKLYDAYVAYPQHLHFREEVDTFALHTMPQVLENACGYKLFIAGRDCEPGQAIVDSVDENIRASRRLLLLYTASTFLRKRHASSLSSHNNNNITKGHDDDNVCETSFNSDTEVVFLDSRQHLEQVLAMHKSLLEGSLEVVLVEMEELSPVHVALLPESVRHLRKKQGAVCWWKGRGSGQRWKPCTKEADQEKGQDVSPNLCPNSKFWKEIRYHMPVRGKRVVYPEKTALLNL